MNNRDAQLNQARTRRNRTKKIEEITTKRKMKNTYLATMPRTEWLWLPLDEAPLSRYRRKSSPNRCSTDWIS